MRTSAAIRSLGWAGLAAAAIAAASTGAWAGRHAFAPGATRAALAQSGEPGPIYALPALNVRVEADVCESYVAVHNVGRTPSVAIAVIVGKVFPSQRVPDLKRAAQVACSGILRPGGGWWFYGSQMQSGTRAAFIVSVDAAAAPSALGPSGDTDLFASTLCERLHARLVDDATAWPAFLNAWWSGATWDDVPLRGAGGAALAVEAWRSCPDIVDAQKGATASTRAVRLGPPAAGAHTARLDGLASARRPPRSTSIVYVLNTGVVTATYGVQLQGDLACAPAGAITTSIVGPGAAWPLDVASLTADRWSGSAVITGDGPFVAGFDVASASVFTSETVLGLPDAGPPPGAAVVASPLLLDVGDNEIVLTVRNVGPGEVSPRLDVFGAAGGGDLGPICPGGVITRSLAIAAPGPDPLALLAVVDAGASGALSAVAGVRHTGRANDGNAYDVQFSPLADPPPDDASSMAVIAAPLAANDLEEYGLLTDLGIGRVGGGDGALDLVLSAYDANGLVERRCRTMPEGGRVIRVGLGDSPAFLSGLSGQMTIAAADWRPRAAGARPGDLVSLNLVRLGSWPREEVPGDEIAATAGGRVTGADAAALRAAALAGPCGRTTEPPPTGVGSRRADATAYLPGAVVPELGPGVRGHRARDERGLDADAAPGDRVRRTRLLRAGLQRRARYDMLAAAGGRRELVLASLRERRHHRQPSARGAQRARHRPRRRTLRGEPAVRRRRPRRRLRCVAPLQCGVVRRRPVRRPAAGPARRRADHGVGGADVPRHHNPGAMEQGRVRGAQRPRRRGRSDPAVALGLQRGRGLGVGARHYGQPPNDHLRPERRPARADVTATFVDRERGATRCHVAKISPGEAYALDANYCVGPDATGSLVLTATEPLSVVADRFWPWMTNARAVPGGDSCDVDADGDIGTDDWLAVRAALGGVVGAPNWNPRADLDSSGWIDGADLDLVAACLPAGVPTPTTVALATPVIRPTPTPWNVTPPAETPGVDATATATATATALATAAASPSAPRMTHRVYLPIAYLPRR
ncbi:MAG: hypothetical protein U0470_05415 [Anaerolineae bacterium]